MDKYTRHVMTGYMDLFLTMGPGRSKPWIDRIDDLTHADKCCLLEEFERVKERYPNLGWLKQYLLPRRVRPLLLDVLDDYWAQRRRYEGGYYYHFLPDPLPDESVRCYVNRAGKAMSLLCCNYVLFYEQREFTDLRCALMMLLPEERDRICELVLPISAERAAWLLKDWQRVVDGWLHAVGCNASLSLLTVDGCRQSLDNYIAKS